MKRQLLRHCREEKKLARNEAAPLLLISEIHLRKLEDGDVNPSASVMLRISKFYGRTPEELFPDVMEKAM